MLRSPTLNIRTVFHSEGPPYLAGQTARCLGIVPGAAAFYSLCHIVFLIETARGP